MINKTQINKKIAELLNIKEQQKALKDREDALRAELMSVDGLVTDKYEVKVTEFTQERIKGAKAILNADSSLYAELVASGYIYEAAATRLNIKEISHRKAG